MERFRHLQHIEIDQTTKVGGCLTSDAQNQYAGTPVSAIVVLVMLKSHDRGVAHL